MGDTLPREESLQDADRFVLAVAQKHVVYAEGPRVGGQGARAGAEDHAPEGHVVELHDALCDVEGVVVGQRNDARAQPDALGALGRHRQEQLRRSDHLPAGGMVLTAPELIEAELVEMLGQPQIALKLQGRVFANRMMRGQERAETDTGHLELLPRGAVMPPSANLERNAMRWNRARFHLIAFARTGDACCRRHDGSS